MSIIALFCIVAVAVLLVPAAAHALPTQPDVPSPLKQAQQGTKISDIRCNDEKILVMSPGIDDICRTPSAHDASTVQEKY